MNTNNFIEFKKERDLGAMITDAFRFFREQWKPFFTSIIKISLVPILLVIALGVFFLISFSDILGSFLTFENPETLLLKTVNYGSFFMLSTIILCFYLVANVMITASSMYYLKSYIENQGKVDYDYVKQMTFNKFWSFVGLSLVTGTIVFIGLIFCFLPGVYLGVILSLSSCLLVFYEKGVLDALSDSFAFVKGHWWETFGILLVIILLIVVLNYATQIPVTIYQFIKIGTTVIDGTTSKEIVNQFKDPVYLLLLSFSYFFKFLLYTLELLVTVFIFFDINEQKNNAGALEKIATIGN